MEGHIRGVREQGLDQDLRRLPDNVIEIIITKVLVAQPFSRILCLCLCRKWRDILLSTQYLLYFNADHILLFNCRRGVWETISLEFCQLEGCRLLNFVASDGGLLCLTTECGEYFVCNPLTKRCRRLPRPPQNLFEHSSLSAISNVQQQQLIAPIRYCLVDIVVRPNPGYFMVILAVTRPNMTRTFMYSSLANNWREVQPLSPGGIYAWPRAKVMGGLFLAREHPYERSLISISNNGTMIVGAVRNPMILMGARRNPVLFFEVFKYLNRLYVVGPLPFSLPLADVREAMRRRMPGGLHRFEIMIIGGEDTVYYVGTLVTVCPRESRVMPISVLVSTQNFSDGSHISSDWEPWRMHEGAFPLRESFHTFKPSLMRFANRDLGSPE